MKIAFPVAWALVALTGPAAPSPRIGVAPDWDEETARERALASLAAATSHSLLGEEGQDDPTESLGGVRGSRPRSLACVPKFTGEFTVQGVTDLTMGIGPINGTKNLMLTVPPGTSFPARQSWYAPPTKNNSVPFFICNKQYKQLFPGMTGYTFRVYTVGNETGCTGDGTDFYVLFKLYNVTGGKVIRRQKETSGPYVLFGNEYPLPPKNSPADDVKYGSALLSDGVYQVSATMHLPNGTVVDKTSFGPNIHVVSC